MTRTDPEATAWPALDYAASADTLATLHLVTQIAGKVRLVLSPWTNHAWHVPLYVTARGLTTSPIAHGTRVFEIDLDLLDHRLEIRTNDGGTQGFGLGPRPVAETYAETMEALRRLGLPVAIHTRPCEIPDAIPFEEDRTHAAYDAAAVRRFHGALVQADRVLKRFRAGFTGKASPVHFFWGSFDLAVTRFSGRPAPTHPGGVPNLPDWVAREAYSHEVSSAGFWPGNAAHPEAAFYAYAYPEPDGFADTGVAPPGAGYDATLGEFLLPYEEVRRAPDPDAALLAFLESTYDAASRLGAWDREAFRLGDPRVRFAGSGPAPG